MSPLLWLSYASQLHLTVIYIDPMRARGSNIENCSSARTELRVDYLLKDIAAEYNRTGNIMPDQISGKFSEYFSSCIFSDILDKFHSPIKSQTSTASLYTGEDFLIIAQHSGWTASISRHALPSLNIYSHPYPTAVTFVHGHAANETLAFGTLKNVHLLDPTEVRGSGLRLRPGPALVRGQFWAFNNPDECVYAPDFNPDTIWFRVSGPPKSHYIHAFRRIDGLYSFSSFSNSDSTSLYFITQLFKQLSRSEKYIQNMDSDDRLGLVAALGNVMRSAHLSSVSEWAAIQALGRLAPDMALAELSRLANSGSPYSGKARSILNSRHGN